MDVLDDAWAHIATFLDAADLRSLSCVNKQLARVAATDALWARLYHQHYGVRQAARHCVEHPRTRWWRERYCDVEAAAKCWREGRCREKELPRQGADPRHPGWTVTACSLDGDILVTAAVRPQDDSRDPPPTEIAVWNLGVAAAEACQFVLQGPRSKWWVSGVDVRGTYVLAVESHGGTTAWALPATLRAAPHPWAARAALPERHALREARLFALPEAPRPDFYTSHGQVLLSGGGGGSGAQRPLFLVSCLSGRPPVFNDGERKELRLYGGDGALLHTWMVGGGSFVDTGSGLTAVLRERPAAAACRARAAAAAEASPAPAVGAAAVAGGASIRPEQDDELSRELPLEYLQLPEHDPQDLVRDLYVCMFDVVTGRVLARLPLSLPDPLPLPADPLPLSRLGSCCLNPEAYVAGGGSRLIVHLGLLGAAGHDVEVVNLWALPRQEQAGGAGEPQLLRTLVLMCWLDHAEPHVPPTLVVGAPLGLCGRYGLERCPLMLTWNSGWESHDCHSYGMAAWDLETGAAMGRIDAPAVGGAADVAAGVVVWGAEEFEGWEEGAGQGGWQGQEWMRRWLGEEADALCFRALRADGRSAVAVLASATGRLAVWSVPDGNWRQLPVRPPARKAIRRTAGIGAITMAIQFGGEESLHWPSLAAQALGDRLCESNWRWLVVLAAGELRVFDFAGRSALSHRDALVDNFDNKGQNGNAIDGSKG